MIHRITFTNGAYLEFFANSDSWPLTIYDAINVAAFMRSAACSIAHIKRFEHFGEELTALTEYVDWYIAIMRVSTHLEMREATKRVNERYRRDERQRGK